MGNASSAEAIEKWVMEEWAREEGLLKGAEEQSAEMVELRRLVSAVRIEEELTRKEDEWAARDELERLAVAAEIERGFKDSKSAAMKGTQSDDAAKLESLVLDFYRERNFTDAEERRRTALDEMVSHLEAWGFERVDEQPHRTMSDQTRDVCLHVAGALGAGTDADQAWAELARLVGAYHADRNVESGDRDPTAWSELERLVAAAKIEANYRKASTPEYKQLSPNQLIDIVRAFFATNPGNEFKDDDAWRELQRLAKAYWVAEDIERLELSRQLGRWASSILPDDLPDGREPLLESDTSLESQELRRLVAAHYLELHPHEADTIAEGELERLARVFLIAHNAKQREHEHEQCTQDEEVPQECRDGATSSHSAPTQQLVS